MKKLSCLLLITAILFTACKKSNDSNTAASTTFTAKIDGQQYVFNVTAAHLVRSTNDNEKRIDITGTSTDGKKRVIITLGEETSAGNGMDVKKYTLNPFPEDDPATPNVDESLTTQGYSTYSTSTGNNDWVSNVYDENGSFTVTGCDDKNTLISGTFETTLTDLNNSANIVKVTAGKMVNIKYTVLN